jgi:hypothetical protein
MTDNTQALITQAREHCATADAHWTRQRAMLAWAAAHRLVRSSGRVTGLGWVTRGTGRTTTLRGPRGGMPALLPRPAFHWDHVSHWSQQGSATRLIVVQPYDITPPASEQVVGYGGHAYRLCWHTPSWHGDDSTLIVILAADEPQRFPYDGTLADPEQVSTLWRVNYRGSAETMPHPPASLDGYLSGLLRAKRGLSTSEARREARSLLNVADIT